MGAFVPIAVGLFILGWLDSWALQGPLSKASNPIGGHQRRDAGPMPKPPAMPTSVQRVKPERCPHCNEALR
jgi:hypothetical protein